MDKPQYLMQKLERRAQIADMQGRIDKLTEALIAARQRAYIGMDLQFEAYLSGVLGLPSLTRIDAEKAGAP